MNRFFLLPIISGLIYPNTIHAETIYLIIKSTENSSGVALHSIPMQSMDQCEESGAKLIFSKKFDIKFAAKDSYECIKGK
tara:strand:- start:160 stop:399 length:240 start_codon:yes stop_codon:yes gene_type:complete